jgi:hypothetical protein
VGVLGTWSKPEGEWPYEALRPCHASYSSDRFCRAADVHLQAGFGVDLTFK